MKRFATYAACLGLIRACSASEETTPEPTSGFTYYKDAKPELIIVAVALSLLLVQLLMTR